METNTGRHFFSIVIALWCLTAAAFAEERKWSDPNGKFSVIAEFVRLDGNRAVLRRSDGKEVKVAIERLSDADQEFIKAQPADGAEPASEAVNEIISKIAADFYVDLRTEEREVARQSLTKKAAALITDGKSPLTGLPQPAPGKNAVRPGQATLDGELAEIPVVVRAGGALHKTKLHLRREDDLWRIFALSATYPDGEKSINFEAAVAVEQDVDPLVAMIGKPIEFEGYTVDGQRLDMSQYKGKVVLVDFWATWCGPCRAEIPNIRKNWDTHHDAGFEVIAVSVDDDLKALESFVAEEKPPWTVVADNHPNNANRWPRGLAFVASPHSFWFGVTAKWSPCIAAASGWGNPWPSWSTAAASGRPAWISTSFASPFYLNLCRRFALMTFPSEGLTRPLGQTHVS